MLNSPAPALSLPATSGLQFKVSDYLGKYIVLYFYPKDATPGCTTQGIQFRDMHAEFTAANAVIFGISRDTLKSHENFKAKYLFPFELISDSEELACQAFDVIKMKNMYGKQVRGIERSTFLIDPKGTIVHEWRGVKVDGHAAEVLACIQSFHS
ncbi:MULTISPECIES: peroxiredoxin [unclassified Methylophilus]|uniref:peroxiredoxin n=1 Tax=unclassified Methylophilus TaxID=2630143 RepID=UPI0006FBD01B|nr:MULTISPECIES: peroxiredoxin [unclassified Methylophilus]KQT42682.1 peroxiredoxin [Methylophilus sp. Leaf416]KQT56864.1 peroxiredoxin [Methylophilus sp. Leaf459]